MRLSVCVPTYNRAGYLAEAVRTLLAQRFGEFELLVVDNASSDDTTAVVAAAADPRVRYHRNDTNLGSRGNWNRCLDLARGAYVAICHDDDLYAPDFLARTVETLDRHAGAAFVHTAVRQVDPAGRPLRVFRAHSHDTVVTGRDAFVRYLGDSHDVVMSTVVARRRCYEAAGRFAVGYLCADFDMWLRLALVGDVAYIATPLVSYRSHETSTSLTMDPARWHRENAEIVRRAIAQAADRIPGLAGREQEFLSRTRALWARRTLKEALLAASLGRLDTARDYLSVSRDLSNGARWRVFLAGLAVNPMGARLLSGVREVRRGLRRVG